MPTGVRGHHGAEIAAIAVVGLYITAMSLCMTRFSYDIWGAFVIAPVLALINFPLLQAAAARETDSRLRLLVPWAFALKLLAAVPRYLVAFVLYNGVADASTYNRVGARMAAEIWAGNLQLDVGPVVGTGFLKILTGLIYTLTGPTILGGFLVFSMLGFWGSYLCYRAFVTCLPDADHWLYGRLVFLLPSMLFWPSSIGKEAWMLLCIGVTANGVARLYTRRRLGFAVLALGISGCAAVRPHIAVILLAAALAGYLLRPAGPRATPLSPLAKIVGVAVLLVVSTVTLQRAASFFEVDEISVASVDEILSYTEERTDEGGSAFQAERAHGPLAVPQSAVQVLVRPFPWEAHNGQALVASLEGLLLLVLAWRARHGLRHLLRQLKRSYVLFSLVYTVEFIYAFSTFGNFGILARERVQVLPMVLALLCLGRRDPQDRPLPTGTTRTLVTR